MCAIDEKTWNEAIALRNRGEFEKASRLFQTYAEESSATLSPDEKRQVEFEVERIRRIRQDYTLTADQLLEQLKKRIPDFTPEEFAEHE